MPELWYGRIGESEVDHGREEERDQRTVRQEHAKRHPRTRRSSLTQSLPNIRTNPAPDNGLT